KQMAIDADLNAGHITAAEALEYGLIGHVVPDGQALDKALEIAEVIANNGPLAVQAILRSIRETEGLHENEAFKIDTKIGIEVFLSEDAKEGPMAFKEKRAPAFKMR
ncbi:MAG: enoyl-CoA hydratase-related protein, partial [Mycobacterium sp.]|nr:enoyl-CoA hydratase-related protein [Mycobacterium sp.]